jgi:uncharacterized protein YyaL (SSP411 family)
MVRKRQGTTMTNRVLFLILFIIIILLTLIASKAETDIPMTQTHTTHPGSDPLDDALIIQFKEMAEIRGSSYTPRTKHLTKEGEAVFTNRLFLETSPYLHQHAHNPVNWYPWGEKAFAKARELNRPILVSIGYATCHWCHVMEEESFEDLEVAEYLNRHFVTVKVDREERPDVDSVYMKAVQVMGGQGGWPLNVFLNTDLTPFYGGTYFPARDGDRGVAMGFLTLLAKIKEAHENRGDDLASAGASITAHINKLSRESGPAAMLTPDIIAKTFPYTGAMFDPVNGGVKGAPKFPSSYPVSLLFHIHQKIGKKQALSTALTTLDKMAQGGIYDHVGGGFHRYSVDDKWLVPHFEKMLYDNALLAMDYTDAFQITQDRAYKKTATRILDYIRADMTSPDGAFYSATDADSQDSHGEMEEGYFFTWTPEEIDAVLDPEISPMFKAFYNVTGKGNFEGRNILNITLPFDDFIKKHHLDPNDFQSQLARSHQRLKQEREKRHLPLRDEKIILSWNALMISAMARSAFVFDDTAYYDSAKKATTFILEKMTRDGRLYRSFKDGRTKTSAFLEDYAFLIAALIDLYEAGFDIEFLEKAIEFARTAHDLFADTENGGYFMVANDGSQLIAKEKPASDNAIPSGNSVMLMNLVRLYEYTLDETYQKQARELIQAFSGQIKAHPIAYAAMLKAVNLFFDSPKEIVFAFSEEDNPDAYLNILRETWLPGRSVAVVSEDNMEQLSAVIPFATGKRALNGASTVYVCENGVCKLPVTTPEGFKNLLRR